MPIPETPTPPDPKERKKQELSAGKESVPPAGKKLPETVDQPKPIEKEVEKRREQADKVSIDAKGMERKNRTDMLNMRRGQKVFDDTMRGDLRSAAKEELAYLKDPNSNRFKEVHGIIQSLDKEDQAAKDQAKKEVENRKNSKTTYTSYLLEQSISKGKDSYSPYSDGPERFRTFSVAASAKTEETDAALKDRDSARRDPLKMDLLSNYDYLYGAKLKGERDFLIGRVDLWGVSPQASLFEDRIADLNYQLRNGSGHVDQTAQDAERWSDRRVRDQYFAELKAKNMPEPIKLPPSKREEVQVAVNEIGKTITTPGSQADIRQDGSAKADFIASRVNSVVQKARPKDRENTMRQFARSMDSMGGGTLRFNSEGKEPTFSLLENNGERRIYRLTVDKGGGFIATRERVSNPDKNAPVEYVDELRPKNQAEAYLDQLAKQTRAARMTDLPVVSPDPRGGNLRERIQNAVDDGNAVLDALKQKDFAYLVAGRRECEALKAYRDEIPNLKDNKEFRYSGRFEIRYQNLRGDVGLLEAKYHETASTLPPPASEGQLRQFMKTLAAKKVDAPMIIGSERASENIQAEIRQFFDEQQLFEDKKPTQS